MNKEFINETLDLEETEVEDTGEVVAAEDEENESEFIDTESDTEEGSDSTNGEDKEKPASKPEAKPARKNDVFDSVFAKARRESETKAEEKSAREQGIIEATGGKNPYTNEELKDSHDIKEFLLMRKIEQSGGDPIADYSKRLKKEQRDAEIAKAAENEHEEWLKKDQKEFIDANPDLDIEALLTDEKFLDYSDGKLGVKSMKEVYAGYIKFMGTLDKTAETKAQKIVAKAKASPGALGGASTEAAFYSMEQIKKMSPDEVAKNYDKVVASLDRQTKKK